MALKVEQHKVITFMTSYKIWVPSKQKYYRFREINVEQYRNILKSIDDDSDFEYSINNLINCNSIDDSFSIKDITIIDRFTILLQLKIHSCGSILNLTRICDKCQEKTNFSLDLNDLIEKLSTKIDCSFEKQYKLEFLQVLCDVPLVEDSILQFNKNDLGERIDFYMYSFIKKLYINEKTINLHEFSTQDRVKICNNIPFSCINTIKGEYIDKIHDIFSDLLIKDAECSNKKCKDILSIKFDISSLTDVAKLLFRDSSNTSILAQYANMGMNCHFDFEFYKNICPAELNIIESLVKKSVNTSEENKKTNNEINMFEQYSLNQDEMVETPSEFK